MSHNSVLLGFSDLAGLKLDFQCGCLEHLSRNVETEKNIYSAVKMYSVGPQHFFPEPPPPKKQNNQKQNCPEMFKSPPYPF